MDWPSSCSSLIPNSNRSVSTWALIGARTPIVAGHPVLPYCCNLYIKVYIVYVEVSVGLESLYWCIKGA